MAAINEYLKGLLLIAVAIFFIALTVQVVNVSKHLSNALMAVSDAADSTKVTVDHLNKTVANIDNIIVGLNKPKSGTITILDADLKAIRIAVDNVNDAAIKERFFLERTQPEEVAKLNAVAQTANETIKQIQPVLSSANAEIVQLQLTTEQIDKLVSDPQLTQTIANVNSTTSHVNATSSDVQEVVHGYLHPTWAHKIYGWALDIAHALNPL